MSMKKTVKQTASLLLFFFFNYCLQAQDWGCGTIDTGQVAQSRPPQPVDCAYLLNDFKTDKDRDYTLQVRLKIWVFCPTDTVSGYWTKPGHAITHSDAVDAAHATSEWLE